MTAVQQDTSWVRSLNEEEFGALVDKAVRGELDDATAELLKDPKVISRSYLALVTMKKSVEGQLAAKKADYVKNVARSRNGFVSVIKDGKRTRIPVQQMEAEYRTWRGGALRFKSGVDTWFMILRRAKQQYLPDITSSLIHEIDKQERHKFMTAYETLREVIVSHRDHVCGPECDEECIADVELWNAIKV